MTVAPSPPVTGTRRWLAENLFPTRLNTLLTIVLGVIVLYAAAKLLRWGVIDAVFRPDPEACRAASGACWGFIAEKFRLMTFGTYPYEQQWRPLAMMAVMMSLIVASLRTSWWGRTLAVAWIVGLPAMWILMSGGAVAVGLRYVLAIAILAAGLLVRRAMGPGARWQGRAALAVGFVAALAILRYGPQAGLTLDTGLPLVETERWGGLPLTLILSTFGIVLSFPLALALALGRRSELPVIRALSVGYIELVRGVPLITVLFMASLMLPLFMPEGVTVDKVLRAQIGFILFAAAYEAEVIRGGLQAIPKGQYEAADALGLSYWHKTVYVILPQALKTVIPPMVNTFIGFFKDTSLVIVIGLVDLLGAVRLASADVEWRQFYIEGLVFVAFVYFAFCYAMAVYSRRLEARLNTTR